MQEAPASTEEAAMRMKGVEVEERPSQAAGGAGVAPFWLHGALNVEVVKMLITGLTPSRASLDALSAQKPVSRRSIIYRARRNVLEMARYTSLANARCDDPKRWCCRRFGCCRLFVTTIFWLR